MASTTFVDLVGPPINAAWLNDVNSAVYNAASGSSGTVPRTAVSKFAEHVSVKDYGAKGDGITNDQPAFQAAVDAVNAAGGGIVFVPPGTYILDVVNYVTDSGSVYGITSIKLKNNVILQGAGPASILKVKSGAYGGGAFYRMISSRDTVRLSNAGIFDLTVDGNRANQVASAQCNNITLEVANTVEVSRVNCINANGNGIMLRGAGGSPAINVKVTECSVSNCATIGIQVSQFAGAIISNNFVDSTGDNCIDIYGEDGDTTSNGMYFTITGNTVNRGLVGIFCETVQQGTVTGNSVNICSLGITVNRINGQPNGINIGNNVVTACPYSLRVTGDTGGISVVDNIFIGFSIGGVVLGEGGVGSCSYVDVSRNFFTPANTTVPCILAGGAQAAFLSGRFNVINSNGMALSYHFVNTATSSTSVAIHSFKTLPYQVGPDLQAEYAQFSNAEFYSGEFNNVSGNNDITVPNNTAGNLRVTAYQGGTGSSVWNIPYVKRNGTLALGTPAKAFITADPIASVTVSSNNARVAVSAANSYLRYGFEWTQIF